MNDKSAFPHGDHKYPAGWSASSGMTFREWQWTIYSAHCPPMPQSWWDGKESADLSRADAMAMWACRYADAMMSAIAEREQERDDV